MSTVLLKAYLSIIYLVAHLFVHSLEIHPTCTEHLNIDMYNSSAVNNRQVREAPGYDWSEIITMAMLQHSNSIVL